jgi:hypothetical protein
MMVAEAQIRRFGEFLERVIAESKLELEGGKLKKAFLQESQRSELLLSDFFDAFTPRWNLWTRKKGTHVISPFFGEQGPFIFKLWLSFIFSFGYRKLEVHCEKGESMVDTVGWVKYIYTPEERQLIQTVCQKHQVDLPEQEVTRILITNAIKSIDPTISKIIDTNYRIYMDAIDFSEEADGLTIHVGFVGRIG